MGRGKSNPETVAAQRQNERTERTERTKAVTDAATGKGPGPHFGTGAWAKANGLWKEGDTEGPKS